MTVCVCVCVCVRARECDDVVKGHTLPKGSKPADIVRAICKVKRELESDTHTHTHTGNLI